MLPSCCSPSCCSDSSRRVPAALKCERFEHHHSHGTPIPPSTIRSIPPVERATFIRFGFSGLGGNVQEHQQRFDWKVLPSGEQAPQRFGFPRFGAFHHRIRRGEPPPIAAFYMGGEWTFRGFDIRSLPRFTFIPGRRVYAFATVHLPPVHSTPWLDWLVRAGIPRRAVSVYSARSTRVHFRRRAIRAGLGNMSTAAFLILSATYFPDRCCFLTARTNANPFERVHLTA